MEAIQENTYDVIVVGSGISGGWAAKEFTEKGFKTLLIERGRMVEHIKDYPTASKHPWEFEHRNRKTMRDKTENRLISRHYAYNESTRHFYINDDDQEFIQEKPFYWIRGYQLGGKSLLWARQTQRWSDFEFEAPKKYGYGTDWPIRYAELAPWYSHVERFVGIAGNRDGIPNLPDSEVVGSFEMNRVERAIADSIDANYTDRKAIIGRCANLAELAEIQREQGRNKCMARSLCSRGCPFGAYFSSNSSTIPHARKTGNLTIVTDTIVESVEYDETNKRATGVRTISTHDKSGKIYRAKVIFLNAATLNTNLILMNSRSERFPNGLGNDNGLLGRFVTFHNYRGQITADFPGYEDSYYYGRRPTQVFMPAFKNIHHPEPRFMGSYMIAFSASRKRGQGTEETLGAAFKDALTLPGSWKVSMMMQGEVIPIHENHVRLSKDKQDKYGLPQLITSIGYTENDVAMMEDFWAEGTAMLEKAGAKNIQTTDRHEAFGRQPGLEVHDVGGVRMGRDPDTSLLNAHNQLHLCKNVFVTDGACMSSVGNQNPSLTFMALTARAANYAMEQLKEGVL
ncbi:GMC oxidoreductase [Sinomicrobium weinanense]|uniref:GMC family oxidoreductase n=1 Tax=Sinomicrobium weinanense TaxID=2842200 RepID=A0A926Q4D5_9FLAO|nr:GMC family oxidoreductase [Sinomicrobium weinanense]MBC9796765.1 GMC family oxidoreductase [Sinomicrobium weinanense]MBU3125548.1 GMC family oxidoreductase [Sinomicrobium weinanense]